MFESIDRMFLAGLGALTMTRERAEKIFDDYVKKGESQREEARSGFVKDLMDSADKTRKEFERLVSEQVQQAVERTNLATREDVQRLEAKLDMLLNARS